MAGIERRAILAGMAAMSATTAVGSAQGQGLPSNPDIVVIGAGAAGLAAARRLQARGLSCVVIEAADRIGGRAWTESTRLGVPYDHGCSWINNARVNPFSRIAREAGFTLVDHTNAGGDSFGADGQRVSDKDEAALDRAYGAIDRAISRAGRAGQDVPAADVIPEMPWGATAQSWMGAMDYGATMAHVSTLDYWNSSGAQPSLLVREGLGAVVATLGAGLPILLNAPVQHIRWDGPGVAVETAQGAVRAKACVITVSTGVLNAGKIKFTPALPLWKQEAAQDIPMGLLMKVPLMFDGARLGLGENNWVTYRIPEDQAGEACYFVAWPTGHNYTFGNIGGEFAWDLWAQGSDAVVDYALDQLVRLVGSEARKHFITGFATDWATNPLTLGAYGVVRPGRFAAREAIARPVGERLFFAGEAAAGPDAALVNGAYLSGQAQADAVADAFA